MLKLQLGKSGVHGYERFLELVELYTEIVPIIQFTKPICKDQNDDMFLATAISGGVEYIVSGDKLLLELDGFCGLQILKPKAFIERL